MYNKSRRFIQLMSLCGLLTFMMPAVSQAAPNVASGPGLAEGGYIVTVDAESVNINKEHGSNEVLAKASQGAQFHVIEDMGDGWVKVKVEGKEGFLPVPGNATVTAGDIEEERSGEGVSFIGTEVSTSRRQAVVNYALQFVGGPYRYGGTNPRTGADCSGFTQYVMRNGAGVSINRSSGSQGQQGVSVSSSQMRPGDLIFYGSSSGSINHVAMYIGNGQIVHASTYKTGIKISNWNYRTPVKIKNVMGD